MLHVDDDPRELTCLTAVLNSRAVSVVYKATAVKGARRIFPKVVARNLAELPYPADIPEDARTSISLSVERLQALNEKLPQLKTGHERSLLSREIAATERQLDQVIYGLFGLTQDEAAVIESGQPSS